MVCQHNPHIMSILHLKAGQREKQGTIIAFRDDIQTMITMNIRSRVLLCITVLFASLAALSPTASATSLILDLGPYQSGVGGEFNAYSASLNPTSMGYSSATMRDVGHGMGFETFCLDYTEHFTPGGTYNYTISQAAIHGGVSRVGSPFARDRMALFALCRRQSGRL